MGLSLQVPELRSFSFATPSFTPTILTVGKEPRRRCATYLTLAPFPSPEPLLLYVTCAPYALEPTLEAPLPALAPHLRTINVATSRNVTVVSHALLYSPTRIRCKEFKGGGNELTIPTCPLCSLLTTNSPPTPPPPPSFSRLTPTRSHVDPPPLLARMDSVAAYFFPPVAFQGDLHIFANRCGALASKNLSSADRYIHRGPVFAAEGGRGYLTQGAW